jgi:hypothetical protein
MPTTRSQTAKEATFLQDMSHYQEHNLHLSGSRESTLVGSEVYIPESPSSDSNGGDDWRNSSFAPIAATREVEIFSRGVQSARQAAVESTAKKLIVVLKYSKKPELRQTRARSLRLRKSKYEDLAQILVLDNDQEDSDFEPSKSPIKRPRLALATTRKKSSIYNRTRTNNVQASRASGGTFKTKVLVDEDYESYIEVQDSLSASSDIRSKLRTRNNTGVVVQVSLLIRS